MVYTMCFVGLSPQLSLLHKTPNEVMVRVLERTKVWSISRQSFREILTSIAATQHRIKIGFLSSVPLFSSLSGRQLASLAEISRTRTFPAGQVISTQGSTECSKFYVIREGSVELTQSGMDSNEGVTRRGPLECFLHVPSLDAKALSHVQVWRQA